MKLIIAGGRNYRINGFDLVNLKKIDGITEVVNGGAAGADAEGKLWAERNGIPVKMFLADWKTYGKAAGPIRNKKMAEYADAVVLFPGGRGTLSMKREAEKRCLIVYDFMNSDN